MNPEQRRILTSIGVTLRDFPESIELAYTAPKLTMTLTQYAAGFSNPINMQDTRACFEAWCLIIKAKTEEQKKEPKLEIVLDVKDIKEADYDGKLPKNGHWGRFLYRILKFSEQYKYWFELSSTLGKIKDKFQNYLDSHTFVTSAPDKKPKEDIANSNLESYVEYLFCDSISAQKDILNLHSVTTIDRQLPVSLFEGSKSSTTGVFTGGKSAIDFWALNVHDVFISKSLDHGKGSVEIEDGTYRSYNKIIAVKQVKGIMLSNSNRKGWHSSLVPPIRTAIEKIMNANGMSGAIQYEFLEYQLNPLKIGGYYISK